MPFLKRVRTIPERIQKGKHPFNIPVLAGGLEIEFARNVTFLVGENGSGKSTILEAIAESCGFNLAGGNRNHNYTRHHTESNLSSALKLSWFPKVSNGFFLRAESFFNFATYIDQLAEDDSSILQAYGGKSLHRQSHGESFLSLFNNRFKRGVYLLDEPEAALSPNRQLSFLSLMHDLDVSGKAQFIIATHSPMLLAYPDAVVFSLDGNKIESVDYRETEHFRLTKEFLDNPERFFHYLFKD